MSPLDTLSIGFEIDAMSPFPKKLAGAHRKGAAASATLPNIKHRNKNLTFSAFSYRHMTCCSPTEGPVQGILPKAQVCLLFQQYPQE